MRFLAFRLAGSPRAGLLHLSILSLVLLLVSCSGEEETLAPLPFDVGEGSIQSTDNSPSNYSEASFFYDGLAWTPPPDSPVLRDRSTGSLINLHGQAFTGQLAEEKVFLPQLYSFNAFWFAWSIFYPGSEIWGRSQLVREFEFQPVDGCLVPCNEIYRACFGGRDCIPSLPNTGPPLGALRFTTPGAGDAAYLLGNDLVIGLWDGKQARAYPRNILWWHEIANERFGGRSFSVTLCPLTGSTLVFDHEPQGSFGVSGSLYNSNLVMYDHATGSLWPQMRQQSVSGDRKGHHLRRSVPFIETTWDNWLRLHPNTRVLSSETGEDRNYRQYPYGDYRSDHTNTFGDTNPAPDPSFPGKAMTTGLIVSGTARAYVHDELASRSGASAGVVRDEIVGVPIAVVFDRDKRLVVVFHLGPRAETLDLEWAIAP